MSELPVKAVRRTFPCWVCGGKTVKLYGSYARLCGQCQVIELRLEGEYIPRVITETVDPELGEPYIDHGACHVPCPA